MRLTRRDALAALAATGVTAGGGAAFLLGEGGSDSPSHGAEDGPVSEADVETLVAAARVLYPTEVEGIEAFVTRYVEGRAEARPEHASGVSEAVAYLDAYADAWYEERFAALDPADRENALDRMDADVADPDPDGSDVERVRYYVVNELLFALYASPTGGELVGIENPQGHPGGLGSYGRGPRQ